MTASIRALHAAREARAALHETRGSTHMRKTLLATGVVTSVLFLGAPLVSGPGSTGAAAVAADTAATLLGGKVLALPGDTVTLTVALWPNQTELDAIPADGGIVPLRYVEDIAIHGSRYTVNLDPATIPAGYINDDGGVDVEVTAINEDGYSDSYNETITATGDQWQRSPAATNLFGDATISWVEVPGNLVVGLDEENSTPLELAGDASGLAENAAFDLKVAMDPICSVNKTPVTHDHKAKVSDVMPAVSNMTGRVTYKIGSSHSLGVAYKDRTGTVSEGGTQTRASSESVSPQYYGHDHTARTWWLYREYKNSCTQKVMAQAESHQGGYTTVTRSRPTYTHCRKYESQQPWSRDTNSAYTYQAGVNVFGINVNAQTGYTEDVTLQYSFPVTRWLCGNNAYPPSATLVAGYATDQG